MKKKLFFIVMVIVVLGALMIPAVSFAAEPDESVSTPNNVCDVWPKPITDPSEAVTFSHPERNTSNPKSPFYNPEAQLVFPDGFLEARSSSFGNRTKNAPADGSREVGHRHWGTLITTTSNVNYTYAQHNFNGSETVPSGTFLFAPSLLGTNGSPLEITTRYWRDQYNNPKRDIGILNHVTGLWTTTIEDVSDYVYNGYYTAEIIVDNGTWYAMLYNYDDSQWESLYDYTGGPIADPRGWCIWEEWYFDESDWPDLAYTNAAKYLLINISGSGDTYVTSSHGDLIEDLGSAPYDFDMDNNYYRWHVDTDY